MQKAITTELVRQLPAGPVDIWDTRLPRFVLRVRATGSASYLVHLGRGQWHTIGSVDVLKPHKAREEARALLGDVAKAKSAGRDPAAVRAERRQAARPKLTFDAFIRDHYEPWALEAHKTGADHVKRLRALFPTLLPLPLSAINTFTVEKWRTAAKKETRADGTRKRRDYSINSAITRLRATLEKAVEWHDVTGLTTHPFEDVKALKTDKTGRVRYLTADEDKRLRAALIARDQTRNAKRAATNQWRRERGYDLYPDDNAGHLTPIVLVALNTGLRRGELFNLRWADVDWGGAQITVCGSGAKSGQTRYVPLNTEALTTLTTWRSGAVRADGYVFPGRADSDDGRLDDVKKAWLPVIKAARIPDFTFHDLRHTFASWLVMAGENLNTVRELLGHADIKMTLRYAHLAPAHKAAAVAKLNAATS